MNTWRAGCSGTGTSGSEGGPQKPTRRKPDRALRSDPYTYVPTWSGMAYVCFITDVYSRMIVGWRAASNMKTQMVLDALEMARRSRGGRRLVGLVTHSDAGSQFTSVRFTERLDEIGARPSIGTVADSFDTLAETTNGLYKTECVYGPDAPSPWEDVDELELATLSWVHWFNEQRLHTHCDDVPPAEFEAAFYAAQQADPAGVGPIARASIRPRAVHRRTRSCAAPPRTCRRRTCPQNDVPARP
jgi:putative transposase